MSSTLRRGVAALALLSVSAASLAACSDDSGTASAPDSTAQARRLAAVTYASLEGPRRAMVSGGAGAAEAEAYGAAITALGTAVSGEGDVDPEVTTAITEMVAAMGRTGPTSTPTTGPAPTCVGRSWRVPAPRRAPTRRSSRRART